ncbi:MAG: transposase [Acidobacteriota bacterium]|nr:transposase [Acidobacteriota bacterium]
MCDEWFKTAQIRPNVVLHPDEFIVMPNHVHGIIWIVDNDVVGAQRRCAPTTTTANADRVERFGMPVAGSIPTIVRSFKSAVTKRIHALPNAPDGPVWQRNYYEHIIRDERALHLIRRYIAENPLRWQLDRYNSNRTGDDPLAREIWTMICQTPANSGDMP